MVAFGTMRVAWLCGCLAGLSLVRPAAAESLLPDRGFESLADEASSPWRLTVDAGGVAERVPAPGFQGLPLHLRAAAVAQEIDLPAGLYELAAIAWGDGELTLAASGVGERTQRLTRQHGTHGFLFACPPGRTRLSARIRGDGFLRALALRAATADQARAWQRAEESRRQFGFATTSPQRPAPGAAAPDFSGAPLPLAGMTARAVLDDPRMNTGNVRNVERLVDWLGANGFERLDADRLAAWVRERIDARSAYGSVIVLCRAIGPATLLEGPPAEPLWLEYLRAGGRIVSVGDLPFYNNEYAAIRPLMPDAAERGIGLLGLDAGWHSPFWGVGDRPVTRSDAAEAWGLETVDTSITGFPVEAVSLAFGTFTTAADGRPGATTWFRNVRADAPWSGLIRMQQAFDGNDDAALRDVWRAAHHVGRPVPVPRLPPRIVPADAGLTLVVAAGGLKGRHEWVRGEAVTATATLTDRVAADAIRFSLGRAGGVGVGQTVPIAGDGATFTFDTGPWAEGAYELSATALRQRREILTVRRRVGVHTVRPRDFQWSIWHQAGANLERAARECADIAAARMDVLLTRATGDDVDAAIAAGVGFGLRLDADRTGGEPVDFATQPELFRLDPQGKPVATAYSGGRPALGISHPRIRAHAAESIGRAVAAVAGIPAFRPYVLCNDDYSVNYGWDYAPHVLDAFRRDTGREAPRTRPEPPPPGALPDDHPWLQWFEWTLRNVDGGFNRAETAAATAARSDVRIGPIPGAMQIPLVSLWEPAQYPPYSFGADGFNLVASYYYNTFWQPVLTTTFWMEAGAMGNRDLPQLNMPDALGSAGYTRNNFYHALLGGVRGLAYFSYRHRSAAAWGELQRLGDVVERIGPVQAALGPATRDVALVNSLATGCFDPQHALDQTYAYHNLMQAHYDVRLVCEEELTRGAEVGARALVLTRVKWLRQSAYDALCRHAAGGGLVLLDASVPFDLPGAKRIAIDLATGAPGPVGAVRGPGLADYGLRDRIEAIRAAVSVHLPPTLACADVRLVWGRFATNGVSYAWFVNALDGAEFGKCRAWAGAGHPGARTPEKLAELGAWEQAQMEAGPYEVEVSLPRRDGVPVDLVAMRPVPCTVRDDTSTLTLRMDRFGGCLVAWLAAPARTLTLAAPAAVRPADRATFTVTVRGRAADGGAEVAERGVIPWVFTLRDPGGQEHPLSGVRALNDGAATVEWTPARNDVEGVWTVEAAELATGARAVSEFTLRR